MSENVEQRIRQLESEIGMLRKDLESHKTLTEMHIEGAVHRAEGNVLRFIMNVGLLVMVVVAFVTAAFS